MDEEPPRGGGHPHQPYFSWQWNTATAYQHDTGFMTNLPGADVVDATNEPFGAEPPLTFSYEQPDMTLNQQYTGCLYHTGYRFDQPSPPYRVEITQPPTPGKHGCLYPECTGNFKSPKDLQRHMESVHPTGEENKFYCRCGYCSPRKDNYKRHVEPCAKPLIYPTYICKCKHSIADKAAHLAHIVQCTFGYRRVGRPAA